jgi:superfamily II DNA or RNA helicase
MELKTGLYEEIISQLLHNEITIADSRHLFIEKEKIDVEESSTLLSRYISEVLLQALNKYKGNLPEQIKLTNTIIDFVKNKTTEHQLLDYIIHSDAEILLSIISKVNSGIGLSSGHIPIRPISPLSQSSLFTGTSREPSLISELKKEVLTSDKIDMLVSFVKWSGIVMLEKELIEFTSRPKSQLRIITTSYMKATDFKAIEFLSSLPSTEIKISYDIERTRLHAKAYLFYRNTGYTTAYIGSSNISNPALTAGLEWNLKVTAKDSLHIIQKFEGTFNTYWLDKEFQSYNKEKLQKALAYETKNKFKPAFFADIQPYPFQEEILNNLEAERNIHNRYRNLVVAATGTGKTVISAFDYKKFCEMNPKSKNRLLFVAHRKEILEQSLECFRVILKDQNFGSLLVGNYRPENVDHLFISIQSFNSKDLVALTSNSFYDFIIVDEFHHAKAPSYKALLEHFKPRILLGLTATPERMDGKDVLEYFDGKIADEIRLYDALNRKLLSPFQYFGVSDSVKYEKIWRNGKYDPNLLEHSYLENEKRNNIIQKSIEKYSKNIYEIICVGFCVTVNHAKYMAECFNQRGLKSIALTADSSDDDRDSVKQRLKAREINFVFVVDIYNEGVDIPEIDTILFLRPTESLTIFLQQLGRGLRLSSGKECLTVLDFIGLSHPNYNFEDKFRSLIGRTTNSIQQELENGFPHTPAGCIIELEKQAKEHILENIKHSLKRNRNQLVNRIKSFNSDTGKELTLSNFIKHYHMSLYDIYSKACWNRLILEADKIKEFYQSDEKQITKGIKRILHNNSRRFIKEICNFISNPNYSIDETILLMLYYDIWFESGDKLGFNQIKESVQQLLRNEKMIAELKEVLEINYENINFIDKEISLPYKLPLDLHCRYTRDEILSANGFYKLNKKRSQREGVLYMKELKTDFLFVTLNKTDKEYSPTTLYNDYAINESLFHWQSQSTTSISSATGQRYINHSKTNNILLLFVRENKKENGMGSPYYYLGPINYKEHSGSRPINITWELQYPMPAHLLRKTAKLAI